MRFAARFGPLATAHPTVASVASVAGEPSALGDSSAHSEVVTLAA